MTMLDDETPGVEPAGEKGAAGVAPRGIHLMCVEPEVFEGSFDVELTMDGTDGISVTAVIEDR